MLYRQNLFTRHETCEVHNVNYAGPTVLECSHRSLLFSFLISQVHEIGPEKRGHEDQTRMQSDRTGWCTVDKTELHDSVVQERRHIHVPSYREIESRDLNPRDSDKNTL